MLSKKINRRHVDADELDYLHRDYDQAVPKYEMPEESMPSEVAYHIINNELNLDGNPSLNLATFVTTWMEEEAQQLMAENTNKNYVDYDEYPQTVEIQNRCVNMLARLFNAPHDEAAIGTATVGSSEAIHLSGLALKRNWIKRRQAAGLAYDKPNIVMGANVQVCWEKFACYFDVEPRYVTLTEERYVLGVEEALQLVDENTIAVVGILGSTLTGEFEPIKALSDALDELQQQNGLDIPIHVDAASGGFVAPFLYPELEWDFRLSRVVSINVSGHKYGLVYPGIGWALWRNQACLPQELIFHVNYLGSDEATFNLNFSKGANQIVAQYYNFLRLGKSGYQRIMKGLHGIASHVAKRLEDSGRFQRLGDEFSLPVVCVRLVKPHQYSVYDISQRLRIHGWIVPAYTLAPNAEKIAVLRIVIREGFNIDMAELLLGHIDEICHELEKNGGKKKHQTKSLGVC